jgi:protein-S-isoprenylcysteine O-methyltransferase Ste14
MIDVSVSETPSRLKPKKASVRRNKFFRYRGAVGAVVLAPAVFFAAFGQPAAHGLRWVDVGLHLLGWVFFFLYLTFRFWATLYIGGRKDHELQVEGPYSVCRNPLYVGSFCFALSAVCFLESPLLLLLTILVFFFYWKGVVKAEEFYLRERFGQPYVEYCRRTPSFWPRWSLYHSPPFVQVELRMLAKEIKRLVPAFLAPLSLGLLLVLRLEPWWPHWFQIPWL